MSVLLVETGAVSEAPTKQETGAATRQRLLEAAEELFSEQGFDRVSVRDVTLKAGANVAAVNYHFGSREGLIEQVTARYINPVNEERVARLEVLERRVGNKAVALEEILDAFVRPFATQVRRSELSEKLFYKLMGRISASEMKTLPESVARGFELMLGRYYRALSKALPGVPEEDLWWRMHFMAGGMVHMMAHCERLHEFSHGASGQPSMDGVISRFIRFAAAGLRQGEERARADDSGPQEQFLF